MTITGNDIDHSETTIATLTGLPAGAYVVNAKTLLAGGLNTDQSVTCRLQARGDTDDAAARIGSMSANDVYQSTPAMQLVHVFAAAGGTAQVACHLGTPPDQNVQAAIAASHTKITAIRVSSVTNTPVSG